MTAVSDNGLVFVLVISVLLVLAGAALLLYGLLEKNDKKCKIYKNGVYALGQIINYITNMLPYMLLSLPFIAVWRILAINMMKRKNNKTTALHEVGLILFLLFLVGLASQTIIPKLEFTQVGIGVAGNPLSMGERLNLIPFKVFPETYTAVFVNHYINYFLINFLGNIIMFMPIGFFIPLLWDKNPMKKVLVIGFGVSLVIELLQLPLGRGTDIDDLWLNTLGVLLGFLVFHFFRKSNSKITAKFKIKIFT